MNDNNVKIWQIVLALVTLTLVIISMVYWLYANIDIKDALTIENDKLKKQISVSEEKISELEKENYSLTNRPPEIKEVRVKEEVFIEKECAPCPECQKRESITKKPHSIESVVCTKMSLGRWSMPKECEKEIDSLLVKSIDKDRNFFVITPIVDTKKYKGRQPELKQAGLGQFRADSVKKLLKTKADPGLLSFQKGVLQKKEVRGFVLELYEIKNIQK